VQLRDVGAEAAGDVGTTGFWNGPVATTTCQAFKVPLVGVDGEPVSTLLELVTVVPRRIGSAKRAAYAAR
jgi:hypothetical protein